MRERSTDLPGLAVRPAVLWHVVLQPGDVESVRRKLSGQSAPVAPACRPPVRPGAVVETGKLGHRSRVGGFDVVTPYRAVDAPERRRFEASAVVGAFGEVDQAGW